eukprot:scaffold16066_cov109-Cylindrotheca_fusiformis.AAC.9
MPRKAKNPVNFALEELVKSFIPCCSDDQENKNSSNDAISRWWWEPEEFRAFLLDNGVKKELSLNTVRQSLGYFSKLSVIEGTKFRSKRYYRFSPSDNSNVTPLQQQQQQQGSCLPASIAGTKIALNSQLRNRLNDALLLEQAETSTARQSELASASGRPSNRNRSPLAEIANSSAQNNNSDERNDQDHTTTTTTSDTETANIVEPNGLLDHDYVLMNIESMLSFCNKLLQHGSTHHSNVDGGGGGDYDTPPPMLKLKATTRFGAMIRFHFECSTCGEEFVLDTDGGDSPDVSTVPTTAAVAAASNEQHTGPLSQTPAISHRILEASNNAGISETELKDFLDCMGLPFPTEGDEQEDNDSQGSNSTDKSEEQDSIQNPKRRKCG